MSHFLIYTYTKIFFFNCVSKHHTCHDSKMKHKTSIWEEFLVPFSPTVKCTSLHSKAPTCQPPSSMQTSCFLKYLPTHNRAPVWKYQQFIFKYYHLILTQIPHINSVFFRYTIHLMDCITSVATCTVRQ